MSLFSQLSVLLSRRDRKKAIFLVLMIVVMSVLDVFGVAIIMPFIAVLSNVSIIKTNVILSSVYNFFDFSEEQNFLMFLGSMVFFALLLSICFRALTNWLILNFTYSRECDISSRLLQGYLYQPYEWYLNKHTSDLGKSVLAEVTQVTNGVIIPFINLLSKSIVVILLLSLLIITEPALALIIGLAFGLTYVIIFLLLRNKIHYLGRSKSESIKMIFRSLADALGGIKDLKARGVEAYFLDKFTQQAKSNVKLQVGAQWIKTLPRFVIEAVAFGGMILVILFLIHQHGDLKTVIPVIALFAFAGYRLIPSLQEIYSAMSSLKFNKPALDNLIEDLRNVPTELQKNTTVNKISFNHALQLSNVFYQYPSADKPTLKDVQIQIPINNIIGFVGSTGSGKSTLIDILLGLLTPTQGSLMVDGKPINHSNVKSWQSALGYVPQQIFLVDDTIAANIAFGVAADEIDYAAVERAAKIANIHDFIINDLAHGYQSKLGERGIRLSGGQRQRLGIARALYHNPKVLILDEATSALDNVTEQGVMESIQSLHQSVTIIIVAHRLSTVKRCDQIYIIHDGKVEDSGSYDRLAQQSTRFKKMLYSSKKA